MEKSPLNHTEQIRMDKNISISSAVPEITMFKVTSGSWASEFPSILFKGNWVIARFDKSEHMAAQTPQSLLSSLAYDIVMGILLHQLQPRSFLTRDPSGVYWNNQQHIRYYSFSLLFVYQWRKEKWRMF